MITQLQGRLATVFLGLLTVAVVVCAGYNLKQERQFSTPPDDGVWWIESGPTLIAERVNPQGPGELSGIKKGDRLLEVNEQPITTSASLEKQLYKKGVYSESKYVLERGNVQLEAQVIPVPADKSLNQGLRVIALIYLAIGFFV